MPFGCRGKRSFFRNTRSDASSNAIVRALRASVFSARMRSTIITTCSGSTVSGSHPDNPSITAVSVLCPLPVSASDPNSSTVNLSHSSDRAFSSSAKRAAARIGPTVCELEGPMPIVKRSVTEIGDKSGLCDGCAARERIMIVLRRAFGVRRSKTASGLRDEFL